MNIVVKKDGRYIIESNEENARSYGDSSYFLNWEIVSTKVKSFGDNPPLTKEMLQELKNR